MAQHTIPSIRTKRSETYDNLINSFDTEDDLNDITLENLKALEFDR